MSKRTARRGLRAIWIVLGLLGGCVGVDEASLTDEELAELDELRQGFVASDNGLRSINGLTARNGLRSINGLTARNGLRSINGLTVINGLATINGYRTISGFKTLYGRQSAATLNVDCSGGQKLNRNGTSDGTCTGEPDGLLSRSTGLMSSDEGVLTAKYLMRCALPANRSVRIRDYTGALITLTGEVGLAPEWEGVGSGSNGACHQSCQELVSACLMALTSGSGINHGVVLTSPAAPLGLDKDEDFPYQEATFYGNLFTEPPRAFVAAGPDYGVFAMRRCDFQAEHLCPYELAGSARYCEMRRVESRIADRYFSTEVGRCSTANVDGMRGVATACAAPGSSNRLWKNPITTYRRRLDFPSEFHRRVTNCQ